MWVRGRQQEDSDHLGRREVGQAVLRVLQGTQGHSNCSGVLAGVAGQEQRLGL